VGNRAIADELFVRVGTVAFPLTGAYRKLGVTTREELATFLSGID
jgi:DNA-binding CsgD family transcriptional regulator